MNKKLRMFNVEFGDSFLLYEKEENLLVDLGSIDSSLDFDPLRDSIRSESVNKQLSLLLTHFHKDHWSGLRNQTPGHELPSLNKVYLPDIFQMRSLGKLDVIVRSLLSEFLDAVILEQVPRFSLADLLREVLPGLPANQICFLSRGNVFQIDKQEYEVLWPKIDTNVIIPRKSKQLREFLERIDSKLLDYSAENGLLSTLESMANSLLTGFADFLDNSASNMAWYEDRPYELIYAQVQTLAQLLTDDLKSGEGELRNLIQHYANSLKQDWNRVSLVFHEKTERKNEGVLMTGDIPKTVLNNIVHGKYGAPKLQEGYAVIKAPHHGTTSYFCAILPQCQYLCISNGAGNTHYQFISELYEHVYGLHGKKASIRCTNARCEYLARGNSCPYFTCLPPAVFYDITW